MPLIGLAASYFAHAPGRKGAADRNFMLKSLSPMVKTKGIKKFLLRFWPWLLLIFLCLLIFLLLTPYLFRTWVNYPPMLRAEIAWRRFCASFQGSCREDCVASRQAYAAIWRSVYRDHPEKLEEKMRTVFAGENSELQASLIKIMAADSSQGALPPILAELIADQQTSAENKRLIVAFFAAAFQDEDWLAQIRHQVRLVDLTLEERLYALRLLAAFPNEQNGLLVKELILVANNEDLSREAFKLAFNWPPQTIKWSEADLSRLGILIKQEKTLAQRWRYLWLLGDQAAVLSDNTRLLLVDLINEATLDAISRSLAAETLNLVFGVDIKAPDPSVQDWQEFYENI